MLPIDHIPQCHISMVSEHLQGQGLPHLPGQLCHCSTALLEKLFLIHNLNPSWHNRRPLLLILSSLVPQSHFFLLQSPPKHKKIKLSYLENSSYQK